MSDRPTSSIDLRLRAIALSLEPALALARIMALPLDELQQLVSDGYFREMRLRGLSLDQIGRRFGKSKRTIATLSKRSRQKGPLLDESRRLGWQREVIRAASLEPRTLDWIRREAVGLDEDRIEDELRHMVESGLLERDADGRYRAAVVHVSFAREDVDARLESLRHFLRTVAHVVYRRFFRPDPEHESFARVLSFSAEPQALAELRERFYGELRGEVIELDGTAGRQKPAEEASIVFAAVATPQDLAWRPPTR